MKYWILCGILGLCVALGGCQKKEFWKPLPSAPLRHAHAHNDYHHNHPLFDALAHGFTSVEADVHWSGGKLLVAHFFWERDAKKTLDGLYLHPLWVRFKRHKGHIFPTPSKFFLWIDVKTDAKETYLAIHRALSQYKEMLTTYQNGTVKQGAVTVILSGERPLALMQSQTLRYVFYDARPGDLPKSLPASLVAAVSEKWSRMFSWDGDGEMPPAQQQRLRVYVKEAHAKGWLVRFWATYDRPTMARQRLWKALLDAGVDLINTDDLTGLQRFLLARQRRSRPPKPTTRPVAPNATRRNWR